MGQVVEPQFVSLLNQRGFAALQVERRNAANSAWEWGTPAWMDQTNTLPAPNVSFLIRAANLQTASIQQWRNNAGGTVASVSPNGTVNATAYIGSGASLTNLPLPPTTMSLTNDGTNLLLLGDVDIPGNGFYYGTNSAGTKGFYSLPVTSTSGTWTFSTNTTMADPGSGRLRINNTLWTSEIGRASCRE